MEIVEVEPRRPGKPAEAEALLAAAGEGAVLVACERHNVAFPHDTVMAVSVHAAGGAPPRTATYTIRHVYD